MAPRVPSHGGIGHTRRVSFLIDLGGGCEEDVSHVRLTVRRLLAHFSRQRPAPRWCVRFYDSGLSPHAFDAKLRARADERATRLAEEEERERERNLNDSRVQSWVDEHTRETAGVSMRGGGGVGRDANQINRGEVAQNTLYRDFDTCDKDATIEFLKHYDVALSLYHGTDALDEATRLDTHTHRVPEHSPRGSDGAEFTGVKKEKIEKVEKTQTPRVDESSWFTTLARQMAVTLQDSSSSTSGNAVGKDSKRVEGGDDSFGMMLVLSRVWVCESRVVSADGNVAPVALAAAHEEKQHEKIRTAFRGIETALRKEKVIAHLLRLPFFPGVEKYADLDDLKGKDDQRATRCAWRRATALFAGFNGCALPAAFIAHVTRHVPPCQVMAMAADAAAGMLESNSGKQSNSNAPRDGATDFGDFGVFAKALEGHTPVGDGNNDVASDNSVQIRLRVCNDITAVSLGSAVFTSPGLSKPTSTVTLTVESLVPLEDTFDAGLRECHETDETRVVLVNRRSKPGESEGVSAFAALLALRRVRALVLVESAVTSPTTRADGPEEEIDVMATQEDKEDNVSKTNRYATLTPLFTGALLLRYLEGDDGDASDEKVAPRTPSVLDDALQNSWVTTLSKSNGNWGCVESWYDTGEMTRTGRGSDDATTSGKDRCEDPVPKDDRPFAFASSPEYKPTRAQTLTVHEKPTEPPKAQEKALPDCVLSAAQAAAPGVHRWERWYGDGPGVELNLAMKITSTLKVQENASDVLCFRDVSNNDASNSQHPKNQTSVLQERFSAMLAGRPVNPGVLQAVEDNSKNSSSLMDSENEGSVSDAAMDVNNDNDMDELENVNDSTALTTVENTSYRSVFENLADVEAVRSAATEAYNSVVADIFASSADEPDPDLGAAAAALANDVIAAFDKVLRSDIGTQKTKQKQTPHDLATKALCKTAKDLKPTHVSTGPDAKARKRREHLFQAHLRFCCLPSDGDKSESKVSNSSTTKISKNIGKVISAVTFLLTPVGLEGLTLFADRELTPRYGSGSVSRRVLSGVRAELGVSVAQKGDGNGTDDKNGRETFGGTSVFSPTAPGKYKGSFVEAATGAMPPRAEHPTALALVKPSGSAPKTEKVDPKSKLVSNPKQGQKGWHPVFRSRATRVVRQVTMANPMMPPPQKTKEQLAKEKEAALKKQRAAAATALIERDGANLRNRRFNTSRRNGPSIVNTDPNGLGSMPAPRRLAAEFGSGNTPGSNGINVASTPAPKRVTVGGLETPAPSCRGGKLVGEKFGSTYLPHLGGLETPAAPRSRAAALQTPNVGGIAGTVTRKRGGAGPSGRGASMVIAATPARHVVVGATPHGAERIAGTPLDKLDGKGGGLGTATTSTTRGALALAAAAKKRKQGKTGLALFGQMVREGREAEENERGGKKTRR